MTSSNDLVIGIDFGTTYSGVAYQTTNNAGIWSSPYAIRNWPLGAGTERKPKVPSEIAYSPGNYGDVPMLSDQVNRMVSTAQGNEGRDSRWGFDIGQDQKRIRCFKLLLAKGREVPQLMAAEETIGEMRKYKRQALDVAADFLKSLLDYTMHELVERHDASALQRPIHFVLGVPASWEDAAIAHSRKAFHLAGYPLPMIVREPEAAAHWAIPQLDGIFKVGQTVMLVDAGGGTVDVISYRVTSQNPLALIEVTAGATKMCGAAFVNRAFEDAVKAKLGADAFARMVEFNLRDWNVILDDFENSTKRQINATTEKVWDFYFHGGQRGCLPGGSLKFQSDEIRALFSPFIEHIVDMIHSEGESVRNVAKDAEISHIVLAGGFGCSDYLLSELQARVDPKLLNHKPATVVRSPDSWLAVTLGSVQMALKGKIKPVYYAWPHYGVVVIEVSDETKDERGRFGKGKTTHSLSKRQITMDCSIPVQCLIPAQSKVEEHREYGTFLQYSPTKGRDVRFDAVLVTSLNKKCPQYTVGNIKEVARVRCDSTEHKSRHSSFAGASYAVSLTLAAGVLSFTLVAGGNAIAQATAPLEEV